jgi:hypothetical protein
MTRFGSFALGPLLLLAALAFSACGSSRHLQSVSLSPAAADAQSFPNGQVPFKAAGTFSKPPSPVQLTGQDVTWCVGASGGGCAGNINPGATVDQNGLAQCNSGFAGTVTILAGQGTTMVMPDVGAQLKIFGTAQLTCP